MKEQTIKVLFETMDLVKGEYLHRDNDYTRAEGKVIDGYREIEESLPDDKKHLIKELDKNIDKLLDIRDNLIYSLGLKEGVNIKGIEKEIDKLLKDI